jgi:ferredoxin
VTYVVTEACIACRYAECVAVCPQQAFHEGPNFVVINPRTCANCALCEMVCPVHAIVAEADLAEEQREYVALNDRLSRCWPATSGSTPLADADAHAFVSPKRDLLLLPPG